MSNFSLYCDVPEDTGDYLIPLFSSPLLHLRVQNWEEKKKALMEIFENRKSNSEAWKVGARRDSSLDVETDYHHNYDNNLDYSEDISDILREELEVLADTFNCGVEVCTTWFEKATRGKMHQVHNHGVNGFSAVCFIEFDPKKHTPTVFLNPNLCDYEIANALPPCIREGSIIFFPSYLLHYTAPNETDEDRVILSFNTMVEYEHYTFEEEREIQKENGEYFTEDV